MEGPGESAYFLGVNRNKKSLALSFQDPAGVEILQKLAAKCDILAENYVPGSLKKYGLDYETLRQINPALIYASITGYGQTGPYSKRAGYDVIGVDVFHSYVEQLNQRKIQSLEPHVTEFLAQR